MGTSIDAALGRITEAESAEGLRDDDRDEQYEAYDRTFRALEDVTPEDDDEGIVMVANWIIERMRSTSAVIPSRTWWGSIMLSWAMRYSAGSTIGSRSLSVIIVERSRSEDWLLATNGETPVTSTVSSTRLGDPEAGRLRLFDEQ